MRNKLLTAFTCAAATLAWTTSAAANPPVHPVEHPTSDDHHEGADKSADHKDAEHQDTGHKNGEHKDGEHHEAPAPKAL